MKNRERRGNRWWISCLFILALMLFSAAALADVAIDATHFPDSVFRSYVTENFDTKDPKGTLTQDEISEAKYLDLYGKGVSDLQGVEYLTNLQYLNVTNNHLKKLDVSKNLSLFRLSCEDNQLTSLDLSKSEELEELYCSGNQMTSLNVSPCEALQTLHCNRMGLKTLTLGDISGLEVLYCFENQITSLNLKSCKGLKQLVCYGNQISSLDVSGLLHLEELYCAGNPLKTLDVSKNSNLTTLHCYDNQLKALDVTHNPKLEIISCHWNQISSLDLSKNARLHHLLCWDNNITSLNVSACTTLDKLVLNEKPYIDQEEECLDFGDTGHIASDGMCVDLSVRLTTSQGLYRGLFLHNTILNFTRTKKDPNPTFQLKADYLPAGTGIKMNWASSNSKVATVDKNGKVKILKAGKATITCTAQDGKDTKDVCKIIVKDKKITKITLNKKKAKLKVGETLKLKAKIKPSSAVNQKLKWTSSNKKVARVDKNGKVLAVKKGTCVIVCTSTDGSKKKASCKITVR